MLELLSRSSLRQKPTWTKSKDKDKPWIATAVLKLNKLINAVFIVGLLDNTGAGWSVNEDRREACWHRPELGKHPLPSSRQKRLL